MNKFDTLYDAWTKFCKAHYAIKPSELRAEFDRLNDENSADYNEEKSMMLHCIMEALGEC